MLPSRPSRRFEAQPFDLALTRASVDDRSPTPSSAHAVDQVADRIVLPRPPARAAATPSASIMKSRQIRAGCRRPTGRDWACCRRCRPTRPRPGRCAKPTNSASRLSCVVPVLPKPVTDSAALRPVPLAIDARQQVAHARRSSCSRHRGRARRAAARASSPSLLVGQPARAHRIVARGDRGIGRGQFEQRHRRGAERDRRLVRRSGVEMPRSRAAWITLRDADLLASAAPPRRCDDLANARAQADLARDSGRRCSSGFQSPIVTGDRRARSTRGHARAQRREIDEQLERRSRLAPRLRRAVERARRVVLAADHRDDARRRGASRPARPAPAAARRARTARSAARCMRRVERGRRRSLSVGDLARPVARCGQHPVGEIGAVGQRRGPLDAQHALRLDVGGLAPWSGSRRRPSRRRPASAARARRSRLQRRREPRRRLDQPGQHRRLADVQLVGRAAEIMLRRRASGHRRCRRNRRSTDSARGSRPCVSHASSQKAIITSRDLARRTVRSEIEEGVLGELLRDRRCRPRACRRRRQLCHIARAMPRGSMPQCE